MKKRAQVCCVWGGGGLGLYGNRRSTYCFGMSCCSPHRQGGSENPRRSGSRREESVIGPSRFVTKIYENLAAQTEPVPPSSNTKRKRAFERRLSFRSVESKLEQIWSSQEDERQPPVSLPLHLHEQSREV